MTKIQEITVRSWQDMDLKAEPLEYGIGMRVSVHGDRQKIHLFSIREDDSWDSPVNKAAGMNVSAYKICSGIIEDYFPGRKVTDFDWEFTASGGTTGMIFEECHGHTVGVHFTNSFPVRHSNFTSTLSEYERALREPENFLDILSDGHPERYEGNPDYRIIVPLPRHPDGHIMLEPAADIMAEDSPYTLVLADAQKLTNLLVGKELKRYGYQSMEELTRHYEAEPSKGDDVAFAPFHTSLEDSLEHLSPGQGYPKETPQANFFRGPNAENQTLPDQAAAEELAFVNGRHRTVNMITAGAPFVPLVMDKREETEEFTQQFGWKGPEWQPPAKRNEIKRAP